MREPYAERRFRRTDSATRRLASRILQYGTVKRKEEGSVLGGLGNLMDGDGW